jgi:hypothetical protein
MRILVASFALAVACSAPPKKNSSIVKEGSDMPTTCCCKTIPVTDDKDITPAYNMTGRMECSGDNGECVDNVQCNGSQQVDQPPTDNGVPPPPPIAPATNDTGIP